MRLIFVGIATSCKTVNTTGLYITIIDILLFCFSFYFNYFKPYVVRMANQIRLAIQRDLFKDVACYYAETHDVDDDAYTQSMHHSLHLLTRNHIFVFVLRDDTTKIYFYRLTIALYEQ